jgi:SIR2-like domain
LIHTFRPVRTRRDFLSLGGYGFGDQHINKILEQALKRDETRRLLVIVRKNDGQVDRETEIRSRISAQAGQIIVRKSTAKEFLETADAYKQVLDVIATPASAPF